MPSNRTNTDKHRFLANNLLKGLIWLSGIIGVLLILRFGFDFDFQNYIDKYAERPLLVFLIFLVSETVFGIIPPEVFMLWAAGSEHGQYGFVMLILASISYSAGVLGFFIGRWIQPTKLYKYIYQSLLEKYALNLKKYGFFLIIVASLTPVPFSAVCMLVGAVGYPIKPFLAFASVRFLRFTLYAWIMLEISNLWFLT